MIDGQRETDRHKKMDGQMADQRAGGREGVTDGWKERGTEGGMDRQTEGGTGKGREQHQGDV